MALSWFDKLTMTKGMSAIEGRRNLVILSEANEVSAVEGRHGMHASWFDKLTMTTQTLSP
jgi:hypothetical protein